MVLNQPTITSTQFDEFAPFGFSETIPLAPTNLVATAGDQEIGLAWDTASGVTWDVYRSLDHDFGTATRIAQGLVSAAYTDADCLPGAVTYYWVKSVIGGTSSSPSNAAVQIAYVALPDSPASVLLTVPPGTWTFNTLFFGINVTGAEEIYINNVGGVPSADFIWSGGEWYYDVTFDPAGNVAIAEGATFNATCSEPPCSIWGGPSAPPPEPPPPNENWQPFIDEIDDRLALAGEIPIYSSQNHGAGTYVRNVNCWGYNIDLTPISPWNSDSANQKRGTLISPRHVLFATHHSVPIGTTIRFVKLDNTVVTRTVTNVFHLGEGDLTVGVLDSDVGAGIGFAKVLPADWNDTLPDPALLQIPTLTTDRDAKLLEIDINYIATGAYEQVGLLAPSNATRTPYFDGYTPGDSGSTVALVAADNTLVLLNLVSSAGATTGYGGFVTGLMTEINAAMTALGGGYQLTPISLP